MASTSTVSINLPCPATPPLSSTRPQTCNCPIQPCCPQTTTAPGGQGSGGGPCPDSGYTCDDCVDGWFCPPPQTPAQPGPNGCFGWACAHCSSGWFCAPQPTNTCLTTTSTAVCNALAPASLSPHGPLMITPTPTIQKDASGWAYAGCWADQPHQPVLGEATNVNFGRPLTNEICVRHCLVSGYTLAATSFGDQCFCGQFLNGTQKLDDASQCATPCVGDETRACGGDWALSCYSPDGQARGWAQIGSEQPNPEVLDPPTVLSLVAGGVGAAVVTVPAMIFPTSGADLSQLQGQYGQSTQLSKAVLPSGVGQSYGGSYGFGTNQPYGDGGSGPSPCCKTISPCASEAPNIPNPSMTNIGWSSIRTTVPEVGSNPTLTLTSGGSGILVSPTPAGWSPGAVAPNTLAPRGGRPTGDAYAWPSGVVPQGEGPPTTELAHFLSLKAGLRWARGGINSG